MTAKVGADTGGDTGFDSKTSHNLVRRVPIEHIVFMRRVRDAPPVMRLECRSMTTDVLSLHCLESYPITRLIHKPVSG